MLIHHVPRLAGGEESPRPFERVSAPNAPAARRPVRPRQRAAAPKPRRHQRRTPWASDAELVREILGGSREHFELLYEAYFPRVYRFAREAPARRRARPRT